MSAVGLEQKYVDYYHGSLPLRVGTVVAATLLVLALLGSVVFGATLAGMLQPALIVFAGVSIGAFGSLVGGLGATATLLAFAVAIVVASAVVIKLLSTKKLEAYIDALEPHGTQALVNEHKTREATFREVAREVLRRADEEGKKASNVHHP